MARRRLTPAELRQRTQRYHNSPFYRGAQQGITLGLADELSGDRESMRARDAAAEESNPLAYIGGQFAGELGSLLLPAGPFVRAYKGLSTPGKIAAAGGAGGAVEGLRGFNQGINNVPERLNNAMVPAAFGAGIGAAVPAIGGGFRAARRSFANRKAPPAPKEGDAASAPSKGMSRRQFLRRTGGAGIAVGAGGVARRLVGDMLPAESTVARVAPKIKEFKGITAPELHTLLEETNEYGLSDAIYERARDRALKNAVGDETATVYDRAGEWTDLLNKKIADDPKYAGTDEYSQRYLADEDIMNSEVLNAQDLEDLISGSIPESIEAINREVVEDPEYFRMLQKQANIMQEMLEKEGGSLSAQTLKDLKHIDRLLDGAPDMGAPVQSGRAPKNPPKDNEVSVLVDTLLNLQDFYGP